MTATTPTTNDRLSTRLQTALAQLESRSLARRLRPIDPRHGRFVHAGDRELVNLASNDYLALSHHPRLKQAAIAAIEQSGVGAGASRLVTGHTSRIEQLEARFAALKHAEAALLFATGYTANLALLLTLPQKSDTILIDKLTHASLLDAAHAGDALMRTFAHLDYNHLEDRLKKTRAGTFGRPAGRGDIYIVTDSVFSMDGDTADLTALCDLAQRHDAITIVDEAHATGVFGPHGEGLAAAQGVAGRIDITVSTASKALGCLGGIVTASRAVIDTLINRARPFIYTTAPPPPQVAAIDAALDVIRDEPPRRQRLLQLTHRLRTALSSTPYAPRPTPHTCGLASPILPLIAGSSDAALALAAHLEAHALLAVAIRPPTVPPATARVRVSLRADLEDSDLDQLIVALRHFNSP